MLAGITRLSLSTHGHRRDPAAVIQRPALFPALRATEQHRPAMMSWIFVRKTKWRPIFEVVEIRKTRARWNAAVVFMLAGITRLSLSTHGYRRDPAAVMQRPALFPSLCATEQFRPAMMSRTSVRGTKWRPIFEVVEIP